MKAKVIQVELRPPAEMAEWFPPEHSVRVGSRVRAWTDVTWEQYTALDVTRHLVEAEAVSSDDFFYRLQVSFSLNRL